MNTLLLDTQIWDLCKDASGNIAMATAPYAIAQDVASAARLFAGELWYDSTQGVPYLADILGQPPPLQLMKAAFVAAAMTVPDVASATAFITGFANRVVTGQIQVTDVSGTSSVAAFGPPGAQTAPLGLFVLGVNRLA